MNLTINHNLMACNVARNLGNHYQELSVSTRRLSSGLRIGTAADDAAGLAVRELMRSDVSTLNQGVRNANDAISMIQTADGALQIIDEKLIRMKELAEQAATGTYTSDQRIIIDSEYQAMASEITRIANATDFNGIYLLNGNLASDTFDGTGVNSTGKLKVHFGTGNDSACDYYYIQIDCCTADNLIGASASAEAKFVAANDLTLQETGNWGGLPLGLHNIPPNVQAQFNPTDMYNLYFNQAYTIWYAIGKDKHNSMHALKFDINTQNYVSDQIIPQFGLCISTQSLAASALSAINNAIVSKDKIRANLGAMQNRLENTTTNLQIQSENLQAAESQISDTDVAQEMTAFVKNQILSQSATAMLAQANSLPKIALQLITG